MATYTHSNENYDGTQIPFFSKDERTQKNIDPLLPEITNKLNLSSEIKSWFNNNCSLKQETYIQEWTIFSMDKITQRIDVLLTNNIYLIDLAFKYLGMGWIIVASYDPKLDKIICRRDGGSSGWDREANFKWLCNYNSDNLKDENITGVYTFSEFTNMIESTV